MSRTDQSKIEAQRLLDVESHQINDKDDPDFLDSQTQFRFDNDEDIDSAVDINDNSETRTTSFLSSLFFFQKSNTSTDASHFLNGRQTEKPSLFSQLSPRLLFFQFVLFLLLSSLILSLFILQPSSSLIGYPKPDDGHDEDYTLSLFPEQIHMNLGRDQLSRNIIWATWSRDTIKPVVKYGIDPANLDLQVKGSIDFYDMTNYSSPLFHYVSLVKLHRNVVYHYQVGDAALDVWSSVYSFTVPAGGPVTVGCIGDLGQTNNSQKTVEGLFSHPNVEFLLMPGDLAYSDGNESRWDRWANLHQPYSVSVPWTYAPGNHDKEATYPWVAYGKRFRIGPGIDSGGGNLYYAFEWGLGTFIMLSSESSYTKGSDQYNWLKDTFKKIDRTVTPWVVITWHRTWYSSNVDHQGSGEPMRLALENLFHKYKVDLCLTGHIHAYERTVRMYNNQSDPTGPYFIVFGNGGNYQGASLPWIDPEPDWSSFRTTDLGYSLLHVINETHMNWQFYTNDANALTDELWITKPPIKARTTKEED